MRHSNLKQSEHYTYALYRGERLVYIGQTKDLQRRMREHKSHGKVFSQCKYWGPFKSDDESKAYERQLLAKYRSKNNGQNPIYNKTMLGDIF